MSGSVPLEIASGSRGDARISVAEKWATRRQKSNDKKVLQKHDCPSLPSDRGAFSVPPLCLLLRRSWNIAINGLINHHESQRNDQDSSLRERFSSPNISSPAVYTQNEKNKRISFPSVLSILKANAVKLQVETMMSMAEENENSNTDKDGDGGGLSVLPYTCNDLTTSAVNHMSDSRSRAFLLLDFSAIVETHTVWRKRLAITKSHKDVQLVYSARHNCNARLLQLLHRLGIGIRVATKYDLSAVRGAIRNDVNIFDDSSILVKPNSFYRNLILNHGQTDDVDKDHATTAFQRRIPITVGDAEEMERVSNQLHRICKRRQQHRKIQGLEFILKLNNATNNFEEWKTILKKMHQKALELPCAKVVGVSLELGRNDETKKNSLISVDTSTKTAMNYRVLLLDALSSVVENWDNEVIDGRTLDKSTRRTTSRPSHQLPQVHLTNPITAVQIESDVIEWIEKYRKFCDGITIDTSRLLMANAAALCTRIIGVKSNESNDKQNINDGHNDLRMNASHSSQQKLEKEANSVQQHLYIDDGCYGSLSNYPNESTPLPLKSQRVVRSLSQTSKQLSEKQQRNVVNTTVWGPTCE